MRALPLFSRQLRSLTGRSAQRIVGRVRLPGGIPDPRDLLLVDSETSEAPPGYRGYLLRNTERIQPPGPAFALGDELGHLEDGDVIVIEPTRPAARVLYRRRSVFNSVLLTERCDHLCLMCCQPPKDRDDSHLVDEILEALPLMDQETRELGFTGGEPTLLGDRFFALVSAARECLPRTGLHVLTTGRRFADPEFTRKLAAIRHHDIMLGVPLYADIAYLHEYVVQSKGAFDDTIRGLLQLRRFRLRIELRFVLHKLTVPRLRSFAEFVARNLTFVDQVALMGMELMGYARSNLDLLWMDPGDYSAELRDAALLLQRAGIRTLIFNHPLCLVHADVQHLAVKSISDWKNGYLPECEPCSRKAECGGFFVSSDLRHGVVRPYRDLNPSQVDAAKGADLRGVAGDLPQ
jgi:His-Xaa-Ser system radical SAM maturase HxsC